MIVIPMAGLSSRFFKAGFAQPKYMLDLHGSSVFAHAVGSFARYFDTERFLIICRDVYDTPDFVRSECAALGLPADKLDLMVLDQETSGQAATVALGLRAAGLTEQTATPLTVFNIDTFRPGFAFPSADVMQADGYLEVFLGEGDHWSFARPDPNNPDSGKVVEVTEKVRISPYCSDGLYHFRRADLFLSLYGAVEGRDTLELQGGEHYVAPLYNNAIAQGKDIRMVIVPPDGIRFCGTPDEYALLQKAAPFTPFGDRV